MNITSKIKAFHEAKYKNVDWKNYGEDSMLICIESEREDGINSFIEEFESWESAGFPDLNEFLTEANGDIREIRNA